MSNFKISFIGGGNMAEAILSKALDSGIITKENTMVCDVAKKRLDYLVDNYIVKTTTNAVEAVEYADIVVLAVKPQYFEEAVEEVSGMLKEKAVVSIMAGVTINQLKHKFGELCRIARVMPNTPALVGEGMSMLCAETDLNAKELAFVKAILNSMGELEVLSEKYMDAFIGIAGSSPAYVYMFIEAMADGGVLNGLPRDAAYKMAAQTVLGSAKMVLETGMNPGTLKDMVCSPGGTTIEAVASLENDGFRASVINAVDVCAEKSRKLSKKDDEEN